MGTGLEGALVDAAAATGAYAIAKIDTSVAQAGGYTGNVKLVGTFKNSGKKVTINVNVVGATEAAAENAVEVKLYEEDGNTKYVDFADEALTLTTTGTKPENSAATIGETEYVKAVEYFIAKKENPSSAADFIKCTGDSTAALGTVVTVAANAGKTNVAINLGITAKMSANTIYYVVEAVTKEKYTAAETWTEQDVVYTAIGNPIKVTAIQAAISKTDLTTGTPGDVDVAGVVKAETGNYKLYTSEAMTSEVTGVTVNAVTQDGKLNVTVADGGAGVGVQVVKNGFLGLKKADADPELVYDGVIHLVATVPSE
jgi:hypothetical protein